MYKQLTFLATALLSVFIVTNTIAQSAPIATVSSPDKKLLVKVGVDETGHAHYTVLANNKVVLRPSKLGVVREDEDFNDNLKVANTSSIESVKDSYELYSGKRRLCNYLANKRTIHFVNNNGKKIDIIFQVSNDGVAFRYYFPAQSPDVKKITQELTSFHFNTNVRAFLQPIAVAKTGWEQTNPSYEEHYKQNIPSDIFSPTGAGWVYPALFNDSDTWVLVTEASLDSNYCATRLQSTSPDAEYKIGFPDPREVFTGGDLLPQSHLPFYSPWRVITIGSLKTIAESTLGTDVAKPTIAIDKTFIKPGKSSWSWINSKDDFIVYDEQKKYIDYAADMHWQYCLIDADWDKKIGYDKVKELAQYAATKNVGILLWYNSSGAWNTVKYSPKSKLLTHEDRVKEFTRLKEMGIKGIKIDFFGGDGQSMIKYYIDILNDAAKFGLLTNFHGATLPRGWSRTYPNLLTTEAIRGFEMITFNQSDADSEANHCAMLPFTRNAFDPMDFTPMNLYKIQTRVKRQTTSAFELATSVLFISGIQHFAESPEGMSHQPEYIKQFLRDLPVRWDDVKFIDGYPGKHVVLARKSGNKWYIAGINGEKAEKSLPINLSSFNKKKVTYITDGAEPLTFTTETIPATSKQVTMKPNGGFVMVLE
jgi:alpha-glucosidase